MSTRSLLSVIFWCLLVIISAGCSEFDSDADLSPISQRDVANEEPLTQYDLDAYIAILPEIAPVEYIDGQEASIIYKKYGLSRLRYMYIKAKVQFCVAVNSGSTVDFSKSPASLTPNKTELSLVNDNWDTLGPALQDFKQKVILK